MRIGIDGRKIPQSAARGPIGSVEHARELGMDGIFFRTVLDMSPTLDAGELRAIRQSTDDLGMYLETGLGKVNPFASPETPELRAAGDGDIVLGFRRMMEACAEIDCRELWVGTANYKAQFKGRWAYDRFRTDVTWEDQLVATERFLKILAPIARDLGIHMNLETHEEITSFELLRLVESVGPDTVGIVLDTANVLQRVEHPVRAAERVAPYVRQTHVKDAALCYGNGGMSYQLRPIGTGVIDFREILTIVAAANPEVNLTIENDESLEDRPRPRDWKTLEVFDPDFLGAHPDLEVTELAEYLQLAHAYEAQIEAGKVPSPEVYATQPFGYAEAAAFIRDGAAYLQAVCAEAGLPLETSSGGVR